MKKVEAFTDGACRGNPDQAGGVCYYALADTKKS